MKNDFTAFLRNLEEVLEAREGSLTGSEVLETLPAWDSLTILAFIAMADAKYGVVMTPAKIIEAKTVSDLGQLVEAAPGN